MRLLGFNSPTALGPFFATIALTGCSQPQPAANPGPPPNPYAAEIKVVRQNLERDLFDPSSVQYRNVQRVHPEPAFPKVIIYCGEINAKNRYGGYAGFKRFSDFAMPLKPEQSPDIERPDIPGPPIGWSVFCKGKSGTPVQF
jgi:hypothetical protein